jgi:hypothetical protein
MAMKLFCGARLGILICFLFLINCSDSGDSNSGSYGDTDSDTDADSDSDDVLTSYRIQCVERINGFRATLGLTPYARWTEQEACTDEEARQDSLSQTPHGAFGQCGENAQNECPGWGSLPETIQGCLQGMWDEGPGEDFSRHGHYINMSSTNYSRVACGFHTTEGGEVWAIQNFH